ncbi:MAG: hypothetical protein GY935_02595, partial [Gammaproteobacteria bacterium]|nr:hypothetical protein [Gammaproteobacteria bacterium]
PTDIIFTASGQVTINQSAGTVTATDPDTGDTITYSLVDDAGGMFSIDANTGELTWNGVAGDPVFTELTGASNPLDGFDIGNYSTPTFVDIDNDGDMDIFSGDADGVVHFLRNDGTSNSPSYTNIGASQLGFTDVGVYSNLTFGDLDDDGDLDALVSNSSGDQTYFRNDGTQFSASFTEVGSSLFGINSSGLEDGSVLVDIDNDGDLDLFTGKQYGKISFQENIGTASSPNFSAIQNDPFGLTETLSNYTKLSIVDLDNDGDYDILATGNSGIAYFFENIGTQVSPSFAASISNPFGLPDTGQDTVPAMTDIDGDGDFDLILGNQAGTFTWYENTSSLQVDTSTVNSYDITVRATDGGALTYDETITITTGTYAADSLTGTTNDDLVYGLGGIDTLTGGAGDDYLDGGYVNDTATFSGNLADYNITWHAATSEIVVTDTRWGSPDGTDTLVNIEELQFADQSVTITDPSVQFNDAPDFFGTASFTADTITTAADSIFSVTTADVDGDGDLDVLSASYSDSEITWYENDGSENFDAHLIAGAYQATSVTTADVDGDGDMDVISGSSGDNKVAWYENDGSENFTAHTITIAANGVGSVSTADVDGDGDMDVLSASYADDKIAWYENDGAGNFTAHTITTAASGASSVSTADVDGDGDMDVISASRYDNTIAWYENDGSENFTAHTITTWANNAASVSTADVDGDGDMDVLSASQNDNKVAWYENLAATTLNAAPTTTAPLAAPSATAADAAAHGHPDVPPAPSSAHPIAPHPHTAAHPPPAP